MTDLTPNDLSHLSDEAFWALCPQGEHAPAPEPLSPAAQAVLDAYEAAPIVGIYPQDADRLAVAAALRAAADQVVPEGGVFLSTASAARIRRELLAIADELENHQ